MQKNISFILSLNIGKNMKRFMNLQRILLTLSVTFFSSHLRAKEGDYIVGILPSQLGNQMFVAAATLSLAIDNQATAYFPCLKNGTKHNRMYGRTVFQLLNSSQPPHEVQKVVYGNLNYKPFSFQNGMAIRGHIWSENYFKHNKDKILPLFAPSKKIRQYLERKYRKILSHPETVAVHIRTLVGEEKAQRGRPLYAENYLSLAMPLFDKNSLFVVFSDHISWCKQNLSHLPYNMIFVENEPYYNDFYLMSMCKHNIVSNSTFSWWAAYLNKNPNKKIVAPRFFHYPGTRSLEPGMRTSRKDQYIWPPEWTLVDAELPKRRGKP